MWIAALLFACQDPVVVEICNNGVDDDGDGRVDCADKRDCRSQCDSDHDGVIGEQFGGRDCNDEDARIAPKMVEICDGVDNNCDGIIDPNDIEGTIEYHLDADGDGWGRLDGLIQYACEAPEGYAVAGDCDDTNPAVYPNAPERCDELDNNCNALIDGEDPLVTDFGLTYFDADNDGFGDAMIVQLACPMEGWVTNNTDCDDNAELVYPGAEERCDGHPDNNCDGVLEPWDSDIDDDGASTCQDDCDDNDAARSPTVIERCNGIDDDCDGLIDLDDDSVNPYTCTDDYCPPAEIEAFNQASLHFEAWNPCVLDPNAKALCYEPGDANYPDQNNRGRRLHRIVYRDDTEHYRDPLFLFLPPGTGGTNHTIRYWMAYAGYRVLSLGYANDVDVSVVCIDKDAECYLNTRYEILTGEDTSLEAEITRPDSIDGRLEVALANMVSAHPHEGWEQYLLEDGRPNWPNIVVGGWSVGAGQAAFVSQYRSVRGVVILSGPKDRVGEHLFSEELDKLVPYYTWADWISAPRATDSCRITGAYHEMEPYSLYPIPLVVGAWSAMGMPFPAKNMDAELDYSDLRVGYTNVLHTDDKSCTPHNTMGTDGCIDDSLFPAYVNLFCNADTNRFCEH